MEDAKLDYLCLYNPDLDPEEENIKSQIVFAYSSDPVDENTNLRRIGLAQGVVEFGKGFADDEPVSTLETTQSRIVIEELEESNWWIVAGVKFAKIPKEGANSVEYNNREVSSSELLVAEIKRAYRRFRLHYGTFQSLWDKNGRDVMVDLVEKWWRAWCEYWCVSINRQGAVGLFDAVQYTKQELSDESVQVVQNTLKKFPEILDAVITRFDPPGPIESRGCVWSTGRMSMASLDDLVRWVRDCEECSDEAYLDDTGFVYHYSRNHHKTVRGRGSDGDDSSNGNAAAEWSASMNATFNATMESMNQLMGLMKMKSMANLFAKPDVPQPVESEDIADSRFVIGLEHGDLDNEHDDEDEDLEETFEITTKKVYLELDDAFEQHNIVVYRRRPFTFTLVYEADCDSLSRRAHYAALHLRLASLVEPLNHELTSDQQQGQKFYYIVYDGDNGILRSSLPEIPVLPSVKELEKKDPTEAESLVMARIELIHVHQAISQLVTEWRQQPRSLGGKEHERFVRTARNWWVYWCQLPDNRQAVFARRWTKSTKPPDKSNGLLAVLGKDAKQWLDNYKYYGKV